MTDRNVPDARRNRLDFWQAASGALLALFVCVHLLLEGTVVLSASLTNGIAWLLEATYVAQISAPIIVLLVVFHFYIAARKMPFRANELGIFVKHSRTLREPDTCLWLVQTVMIDLPISVARSAERMTSGWLPFYVIFLPCVVLHTGIGIYRLAAKYGYCTRATRQVWRKRIWIVMACYLVLGFLAMTRVWFHG